MKHWTLDDIHWDLFDPHLVTQDTLSVIKTASVVEHNGMHYADYLHNVFHDDPELKAIVTEWAKEEVQHGVALGKWAELADPFFSFDKAFKKFSEGYKLPLNQQASVRGSQAGELIARCIVETGTSSFYTAIADSSKEPVLQQIARYIAGDEFRHYKLFYDYFKKYNQKDKLNLLQRCRIAIRRIAESSDDELAYAFYAANGLETPYIRKEAQQTYARLSYAFYQKEHIDKVIAMAFKPVGLNPHGFLSKIASFCFARFMNWQKSH